MANRDINGIVHWESGLPANRSGPVDRAVVKYENASAKGTVTAAGDGSIELKGIDDAAKLSLVVLHEGGISWSRTYKAGSIPATLEIGLTSVEGQLRDWKAAKARELRELHYARLRGRFIVEIRRADTGTAENQ